MPVHTQNARRIALLVALLAPAAAFSQSPDYNQLAHQVVATSEKPLLLRHPTISRTQIVFAFANDLWSVNRDGGDAVRLTIGIEVETDPIFSPDGSRIAFTGEYDGNADVFVVPAAGGTPKQLRVGWGQSCGKGDIR